ncbi:integrase core domain-containing protein [Comamonas aquatilis]|uniref:integrase core domain-containing protein n=1 Tax=Comamonas aquatilis TaxID=1778406 RepID=UPI0039F09CA7
MGTAQRRRAAPHSAGQADAERCFNRTYRTKVLDCCVFESLQEVRSMTKDWLHRYNHPSPHESLRRIPPAAYRAKRFPNLYF